VICYLPSEVVPTRPEDEALDSSTYRVENYFRAVDTSQINWARTFAEFETAPAPIVLSALRHLKHIYSKHMHMPSGMKLRIPVRLDMGFCIEAEPPTPDAGLAQEGNIQTSVSSSSLAIRGILARPVTTKTSLASTKDKRVRKTTDNDYKVPHFKPPAKRKTSKPLESTARKRVRIAHSVYSDADDEAQPTDVEGAEDVVIPQPALPKTKTSLRTKSGMQHEILRHSSMRSNSTALTTPPLAVLPVERASSRTTPDLSLTHADIKKYIDDAVKEVVHREFGQLTREFQEMRGVLMAHMQDQRAEHARVQESAALYRKTVDESAEAVRKVTTAVENVAARIFERIPPMGEGDIPNLSVQQLRVVMNQFTDLFDGYLHISSTRDSALRYPQQALTPTHHPHHHGAMYTHHMPYAELSHHRSGVSDAMLLRPQAQPIAQSSASSTNIARMPETSDAQAEVTTKTSAQQKEVTVTVTAEMAAAIQQLLNKEKSAQADKTGNKKYSLLITSNEHAFQQDFDLISASSSPRARKLVVRGSQHRTS
jgi:hypothetical protein